MSDVTVFQCGLPRDHECDNDGPTIYGGDGVPTTTDQTKAGKGYSWGSVTCSKCGMSAMEQSLWREEMKIPVYFELIIPPVPDFIFIKQKPGLKQDGIKELPKTSIADLLDNELKEIGAKWIEALINRAHEIRSRPEPLPVSSYGIKGGGKL